MAARILLIACAASVLILSEACGGGSSGASSGGSCWRAPIPTTGPGDTLGYFPIDVGRSWMYTNQTGASVSPGTTTISVAGSVVVNGETVYSFTSSNPDDGTSLIVMRGAGVYELADPSAEPPLDQLYPSLLLPFPVAPAARQEEVRCDDVSLGDLDGDGYADRGDVRAGLSVLSITEPVTVGAGRFTTAHVHTDVTMTVRATSAGTVKMDGTEDDWYAQSVGLVYSLLRATSDGTTIADETHALLSYSVPDTGALPASCSTPLAAASLDSLQRSGSVEEAALRIARRILTTPR
jgi:hypothetical protein